MNNTLFIDGKQFPFIEFSASMSTQLYIELTMGNATEAKHIIEKNKHCLITINNFAFNVVFCNQIAENKILFIGEHK